MKSLLDLIDQHDTAEREFTAAIHGVDLTGAKSDHGSPGTVVGLDAFYRQWFPTHVAGGD